MGVPEKLNPAAAAQRLFLNNFSRPLKGDLESYMILLIIRK
jgi:hypothetical protein